MTKIMQNTISMMMKKTVLQQLDEMLVYAHLYLMNEPKEVAVAPIMKLLRDAVPSRVLIIMKIIIGIML